MDSLYNGYIYIYSVYIYNHISIYTYLIIINGLHINLLKGWLSSLAP